MSFVLLTHDQERWAGEAAASVLSQTYRPLEVILSDDCSSDATFEVLRQAAADYRGPHRVILNRNPTNLGVAAHTWRAAELASGTLLAIGHGDDVSLPDRVAATTAAFTTRPDLAAVTTRTPLIDAVSAPITGFTREGSLFTEAPVANREARVVRFMRVLRPSLLGAATTWRRDLFDRFGPVDPEIRAEDLVLSFRALLAGEVMALDQPGIRYRIHGRNTSLTDGQDPAAWAMGHFSEAARATWLRVQRRVYPQLAEDLRRAAELGLVDFDPTPHLAWMTRQAEVVGLLAAQRGRKLPSRMLLAARVLVRRPGVAAARAALLRVLPGSAIAAVRRFRG